MSVKENLLARRSVMTKPCKWCGKQFHFRRSTKEFCSDNCRAHYNINKTEISSIPKENVQKVEIFQPKKKSLSKVKKHGMSHIEGLEGVVEDHNVKQSENPKYRELYSKIEEGIVRLSTLNNYLTDLCRDEEAVQKMFMAYTGLIGGGIGFLITEKKANFWNYLLNTSIGAAVGHTVQTLRNSQLQKRLKQLSRAISQTKLKISQTKQLIEILESQLKLIPKQLTNKQVVKGINYPEVAQLPIQSTGKIISSSELIVQNFKSLDFKGNWKELIGKPSVTFHMIVHGISGQGKSTFCLQFANYLASKFGRVLYITSEEGHSKTMKDKLILSKIDNPNLLVADIRNYNELKEEVAPNQFHFIFIDSLNDLGIDIQELKELREMFSNSALITISQSTKNGQLRGSQQVIHDCDVEIRIERGIAKAHKNRFCSLGYEFEIF